jgi:hypothetical protein
MKRLTNQLHEPEPFMRSRQLFSCSKTWALLEKPTVVQLLKNLGLSWEAANCWDAKTPEPCLRNRQLFSCSKTWALLEKPPIVELLNSLRPSWEAASCSAAQKSGPFMRSRQLFSCSKPEPFLRSNYLFSWSKTSPLFIEPEVLLPCSQSLSWARWIQSTAPHPASKILSAQCRLSGTKYFVGNVKEERIWVI